LVERDDIAAIFLHERRSITDLNDSIFIARSNIDAWVAARSVEGGSAFGDGLDAGARQGAYPDAGKGRDV
jgi:hypothetical protein